MLYVFQVDTGTMLNFDMNLALDSVSNLKETIWKECRIPVDRQVLLVSGGECLDPGSRVCNYASGTDTNPIFLFNKINIESSPTSSGQNVNAPSPTTEILANAAADLDNMREQVDGCLALPPTYMTVVARSQLAQQLWELSKELTQKCEQLIHDQHLQHQGWAAVIANLEDLMALLRVKTSAFEVAFKEFLSDKEERSKVLLSFERDVEMLESIEIIPSLLPPESESIVTLKDWIISLDSPNKLESIKQNCMRHLEKLDTSVLEEISKEAAGIIEKAGSPNMKEIKGLEERLYGLDQLLQEARKLVGGQYDLAQAFLQNQNRASDLKDPSILPDLCASHAHQLKVMSRDHLQLEDIRRRCSRAKEELSSNLNVRLKWIIFIQKSISDCSNKITVYQETLKRLKCHIDIIDQIHTASELYCDAVKEVVRRTRFSEFYSQWANSVAERMEKVHNEESNRRRDFGLRFDTHFLTMLFPGLNDYPSLMFNAARPPPFDQNLPKITNEEWESLKKAFPSLNLDQESLDFSSEFPLNEMSSHSTKSAENLTLKMEIESLRLDLKGKGDECAEMLRKHEEDLAQIEKVNSEKIQGLQNEIDDLKTQLKDKEANLKELESTQSGMESKLKGLEAELERLKLEKDAYEEEKGERVDLEVKVASEKEEWMDKLLKEKEEELRGIKEGYKREIESLRSRFKLVTSTSMDSHISQSPTTTMDNVEKSFEMVGNTQEIITDMSKIVEVLEEQTKGNTLNPLDGVGQLLRNVLRKVETTSPKPQSPALIRARVSSFGQTEGNRTSIETSDDDGHGGVGGSGIYGLDTSVIDVATAISQHEEETSNKEFLEMLIPPEKILQVANKLTQQQRIVQINCKVGDLVLIYWKENLGAYMVCLNAKNVHFVHSECLRAIGHTPGAPVPALIAQISDKEFCVARRSQNRYRVPQGFHFYRVRILVIEKLDLAAFSP